MRSSSRLAVLIAASSAALSCVPYGVGVTVPVGVAPAPIYGPGFEVNVDRPGMDYRNFDLPAPQPDMCRNQCMSEPSCVAFTYVNPGVQGPNARCWLKGSIPQPTPNGCCISGVVRYGGAPPPPPPPPPPPQPQPQPRAFERGVNRRGMDYRNFDLPSPNPELCWNECLREPRCLAYTYVHPGVQGPAPRCWLKDGVPNPTPESCCVSGVK
ncbi:MAG TPA: PAN domain-containing protein [Polyangia bacterium]|nr:PAN domain-containing protein [Polyangia bacterium]